MLEFPFYKGDRKRRDDGHVGLPAVRRDATTNPEGYVVDPGLRDAVNVALMLGIPLLVTGEPGTGKTQLAYSLAFELGFDPPLEFETKSTSTARDLFYTYDALGRYHKDKETSDALSYITFSALGTAILRTLAPQSARRYLTKEERLHEEPCRSVVLIDEIDKAPRDFPNDVLRQIEGMFFRIPELGNVLIRAEGDRSPVVIITSNSEKNLPNAFLRRCAYFHIPFPDENLEQIVNARLGDAIDLGDGFLSESLELFRRLRKPAIGKKPATAELLHWLMTLRGMAPNPGNPLRTLGEDQIIGSLAALVKAPEDRETSEAIVRSWLIT